MMGSMSAAAKITVTAGPDAGQAYALSDELVHIGRAEDNQVVLTDPTVSEHQASIVRRNGRYAIYSTLAGAIHVDENEIPAERWVWLPQEAQIRVGRETVFRLEAAGNGAGVESSAESTPTPASSRRRPKSTPPGSRRARKRARTPEAERHVAKFISDRSGAPLVQLGDDGQLPALELSELAEEHPVEKQQKSGSNPLLLYGAMGFSIVMSLGMLLIDPNGASTTSTAEKDRARLELREFFGENGADLEPYQRTLRQAVVAHSQGDFAAERAAYRSVLRMLNSADVLDPGNPYGLTGRHTGRARSSDEDLREALNTLLAE
ncbi:MAG: FHA domain-containing protein [Planctomycetota bacterium]|nr:MAG: FHA domain-containing protein [Planctomycetota bacterium]